MGNDHTAWMPVYWRDVLAATTHLTPAQFGAYCLLMAAYWNSRGPLLADPERLRRIARMNATEWREAEPALAELFTIADGRWVHASMSDELAKAEARYRLRADAGRLGGLAKAKRGPSTATAQLEQPQPQAHESPVGASEGRAPEVPKVSENDGLDIPSFLDRRSERHATRLSADWRPDEEGFAFAHHLGIDRRTCENVLAQFRDHWSAKPGRDGLKSDWDATWRNWLRKHIDFHGTGPWPVDGGRRSQGNGQGRGGVLAAVGSLMSKT